MKYLHDWTSALSYIYDRERTKRSQIANCDPFFMFSIFKDLKQNFFRSGISTIHAKKMIRKSRACYIQQIPQRVLWVCYINDETLKIFMRGAR